MKNWFPARPVERKIYPRDRIYIVGKGGAICLRKAVHFTVHFRGENAWFWMDVTERICVASQHRQTHQDGRALEMFSIPRNAKGNYDWNAIADGRYYVEWYAGGTRRREGAGVTAAQALEAQRRKRHELEGRKLGVPGFEAAGETPRKAPLHVAVNNYLEQIEALKKPNTHRKYEAVLGRFLDFFRDRDSIDAISGDDLTRFAVTLKKDHGLGSNTILHNAVIIAQFLKRHGRSGITRAL
jgi:hypothetical protein